MAVVTGGGGSVKGGIKRPTVQNAIKNFFFSTVFPKKTLNGLIYDLPV
jgi:hypothetical protein